VPESTAADFGDLIAARIRAEHLTLSSRWLERLRTLLPVPANDIFPGDRLLDHIPALIQEIAAYLRMPSAEAVAANTGVISKAQQLGELRHSQQASVHQLLAEYRLLGGVLSSFVQEEFQRLELSPAASEAIELLRRLNEAVWILLQTTVDTFVADYTTTIVNHASRLESFNRMVSHELRQPLGTLTYAMPLLKAASERGDVPKQTHLLGVMERNVASLLDMLQKLELVSRVQTPPSDTPAIQHVELRSIAGQVKRQLREMADARGVEIVVSDGLPSLTIEVARLELILVNLLSNGIKYSDPAKSDRFVAIEAVESADPGFCVVVVRDNGLGIPQEQLTSVFKRFVRAHAERDHELGVRGSGLGLSIVEECLDAIGARIAIESSVGEGTSVLVTLPNEPPTRVSTFDVPEAQNPD